MIEGNLRSAKTWEPKISLPALLVDRGTSASRDVLAWRLIDGTTDVVAESSFRALYRRSCWIAHKLYRGGIRRGDVVVLLSDSRLEFIYALFGTMLCGAIPAAVYPPLDGRRMDASLDHIGRVLEELDAAAVATTSQLYGVAWETCRKRRTRIFLLEDIGESDIDGLPDPNTDPGNSPVLLQYTSGSLGNPKAIELSTPAIFSNLAAIGDVFAMRGDDVGLSWLPLYHDMGLHAIFFGLMFNMPALLMSPMDFLRHPSSWLKAISRYQVTHSPAPNFGFAFATRRIRDADLAGVDLSRWRVAMCGAEPIQSDVLGRFANRFSEWGFTRNALMPAYGLAENVVGVSYARDGMRTLHVEPQHLADDAIVPSNGTRGSAVVSVGTPLPGHQIRIVAGAKECSVDQVGEVEVAGPSHMLGFRGDAAASSAAFDGAWLRTGDRGFIHDGELYITGRAKDLIIRAGKNYYPQDIEQAATTDGVAPGCVCAFSVAGNNTATEAVVVVAEVRSKAADLDSIERTIRGAVRDAVGISLQDVQLVARGVVPKTTSGKLRRAECKRRYESDLLIPVKNTALLRLLRIGIWGLIPRYVRRWFA